MTVQTPGTILRLKREEKKLTLDQVFQAIRIRPNYLQAIEADQLDLIPSQAQARGFIRIYAAYLELDPFDVLPQPVPEITPEAETSAIPEKEISAKEKFPIKDKADKLAKSELKKISNQFSTQTNKVKNSVGSLIDKIPYRIVKKGQEEISPTVKISTKHETVLSEKQGLKYKAMCKAIGDDLRAAREALGLSLSDVERQTRIREAYLYAIENGNLDDLPSTVQGRGMLSNYAAFMNLNSEQFLSRFAEALQQRRIEATAEAASGVPIPAAPEKQRAQGWKRLLSPDILFTGGLFLIFFVFIIWGSFQLMGIGSGAAEATVMPISDVLLASGTPTTSEMVSIASPVETYTTESGLVITPDSAIQATLTAPANANIQLVIIAQRRAYMKVVVDGKEEFLGRILPGTVYNYLGNTKIALLCGDGSAIQVYYNQSDLGIMGISGQVINMEFTASKAIDLTANYTPTPTVTQIATLTPNPTETPTKTPALPTPSATATPTLE